jgi:signal transduction histidine kinase
LFEPFYRGKNIRSIPGTGLGLVVVKKCVDLHRGSIEITSEVGRGTSCLVSLPFAERSDLEMAADGGDGELS